MDIPRGLRLNNAGNIRHGDTRWVGMAKEQPDAEFVAFTKPVYGIRALARTLVNYGRLHNLKSVREIIGRWAPSEDSNDTESYISDVAERMGVDPDDALDLESQPVLRQLAAAIIHHENGAQPYAAADLAKGVAMALT